MQFPSEINDRQERARRLVFEYVKDHLEKTDKHPTFSPDEVYVVWFSKTLQNWKALVATTLPYGLYFEVTYDGNKRRTYIDVYQKTDNVVVPDDDVPPAKAIQATVDATPLENFFDGLNPAGPDRHA